jgi:phage terminase large subunit
MKPQTKVDKVSTGYTPREWQQDVHYNMKRFNVIVLHRRAGKTHLAINEMLDRSLRNKQRAPRYAYLAPFYGMAKRVAWDILKMYAKNIPGVSFNEAELRCDFSINGARIMLLGADNPDSLRGIYLDGVILDEYAQIPPSAWREVIRPALSDRKGWAIWIGTPKGRNHFKEIYEYAKKESEVGNSDWYSKLLTVEDTKLIDEGELAAAKGTMSEESFLQEFYCDWGAGMTGAYFTKEIAKANKEGRITDVPYDENLSVDTYWDLGMNDVTAIWFVQTARFQHRIIKYVEGADKSVSDWIKDLRNLNYGYGRFILPHDAKARDMSTGKSIEEAFRNLGVRNTRIIPRVGDKRDSINAARMIFSRCYFDKTNCDRGLEVLSNYRRKFDEKSQSFSEKPLHDWASNGADAFQCFAMGCQDDGFTRDEKESRLVRDAIVDYNPLD